MNTAQRSAFKPIRRLWWATLPYWGWVDVTPQDVADGARPCPWWAHPLAKVNRLANAALGDRDVFGPRHRAWSMRPAIGSRSPQPWQ